MMVGMTVGMTVGIAVHYGLLNTIVVIPSEFRPLLELGIRSLYGHATIKELLDVDCTAFHGFPHDFRAF